MTSKKYSVDKKTASYDLKQSYKSIIVPAVISLLLMSVDFLYNIYGFDVAKQLYSCYLTSEYLEGTPLHCVLIGILFALFSFSYIMRKKKVNVFFSMPIDRATMFKNRVLASVSLMAGTIIVPLIVDVMVNIYLFGNASFMITMGFWLLAESFVYMLTAFAFMSVALALCYTMIEGTLFGLSLIGFPMIATLFCDQFNSAFLDGYSRTSTLESYYWYNYDSFFHRPLYLETTIVNPFMFGVPSGSNSYSNDIYSLCHSESGYAYPAFKYILPVIVWAVISAALVFLAKKLFINRKAEKAGIFSSNKPAIVFIGISASLLLAAFSAYIFSDTMTKQITAVFSVILVLLCFLVISAIFNKKIVLHKHCYISAATVTVFTAVFSVVLICGGFGYSSYVPKADEIAAAYITNNCIDNKFAMTDTYTSYYNSIPVTDNFTDNDFGIFEDEEELKLFTQTAKEIAENDNSDDNNMIYVAYRLKNGKNVYRHYENVSAGANYKALSLTQTDSYKNEMKSRLLPEKYGKNTFNEKNKKYGFRTSVMFSESLSDSNIADGCVYLKYYSDKRETVSLENNTQLREALLKDLLNTNPDEYFRSDEKSFCSIGFTSYYMLDDEPYEEEYSVEDSYTEYGYDFTYRVYPYMTNTVKYLKSVGELQDVDVAVSNNSIKTAYCIRRNDLKKDNNSYMYMDNQIFDNFTSFWNDDSDYYAYDMYDYEENGDTAISQNSNSRIDFSKFTEITDVKTISTLYSKAVDFRYCDNSEWYVIFEYDTNDINKRYLPMMVTDENMPDNVKSMTVTSDKSNKTA